MRVLARAAHDRRPFGAHPTAHVVLAVLDSVDDPLAGSGHDVLDALGVDARRFRRDLRRAVRRS